MSIHQPRYSIFKTFDTISLLSVGEFVYQGPADEAINYFEEIGNVLSSRRHCKVISLSLHRMEFPRILFLSDFNTFSETMNLGGLFSTQAYTSRIDLEPIFLHFDCSQSCHFSIASTAIVLKQIKLLPGA